MVGGDSHTGNSPPGPAQLLPLALSRPQDALVAARSVLAGQPSAYDASLAHHAIGVVLRDRGDLRAAIAELRRALELARASGRSEREADVRASLGVTLAWTGRSQQGLSVLSRAVQDSRGGMAGRVLMRRANILQEMGRFREAHEDLSRALLSLRRAGDTVWEARTLTHRAFVFLGLGLPGRARAGVARPEGRCASRGHGHEKAKAPPKPPAGADFARAEELYATSGQELEYAKARHNRALVALISGDLPEALACLDEAANRYEALGETLPDLAIDRCSALLAAGLAAEAAQETEAALGRMPANGGIAFKRAELLFAGATAALAAGQLADARQRAGQARRLFQAHRRPFWAARSALVLAQARYAAGERSARLYRYAEQAAAELDAARSDEALQAHLLSGRLALSRTSRRAGRAGRASHASRSSDIEAGPHLERAAQWRRNRPPLTRSVAWLARALQADARGSTRATLAACARGLDALEEHQLTLGATELRAYGTSHGAELAALAQRDAVRRGDARKLLSWSERWRATALAARGAPLRDDTELAAELEALRSVSRLLDASEAAEMAASRRNALERERRRLEKAVQARTRRSRGARKPGEDEFGLDALSAELGKAGASLIELAEVDGVLHAVIVAGRRVRLHTVGTVPGHELQMSRFVLRRMAHGRAQPGDELVLGIRGAKLEESLLGAAAAHLEDGPVVVIPPGRLRAVPWTLMPSLRDRAVTVAPSASTWLRARRSKPPSGQRVALVTGPRLATKGAEVTALRERYPEAVTLAGGSATADRVLDALDGAWLAHLAAHGTFRADNPMFSSILLDDGPLTVHDFERLGRAPYRLVLSSCDSGVGAVVGADELLGLVSSLVPLGAAGIVASLVPVNDQAAVPLMLALHDALRQGATLAEALRNARHQTGGDPVAEATAHSFTALGA